MAPWTDPIIAVATCFVLDAELCTDSLSIRFDGLKRVKGRSQRGDFHYVPLMFCGRSHIHKSQRLAPGGPQSGRARCSFWADNKNQERNTFEQLVEVVARFEEPVVFCYGSYEKTFIQRITDGSGQSSPIDIDFCSQHSPILYRLSMPISTSRHTPMD